MARTAGKKQAPAKVEEDDDVDGWDDAVVEADGKESEADLRLRDWRDVERYREMKELRGLVDEDDSGLQEIFHVPLRPRVDAKGKAKVAPAKAAAAPAPAAAVQPGKPGKTVPNAVKPRPDVAAKPTKPEKAAPAKAALSSTKARTPTAPAKAAPARKAAPAKLRAKAKRK